MFNVGPFEMVVLVAVALIVFGPDKLPQLAKDAARMLRTLRDLAQGARSQLNDELGPEFADLDLRSLNPRTAIRNALLGDEELPNLNPREAISRALRGEDDPPRKPAAGPAAANPVNSAPLNSAPVNSVPVNSAPVNSVPVNSAPANSAAAAPAAGEPAPDASTRYEQDRAPYYPDPAGVPYDPDAT
ncbi:MAG TPA: sec-independent translocase [Jatrophihabitans sp.]|nr:sec-independent translocase [Jatrophihabitans sp.]